VEILYFLLGLSVGLLLLGWQRSRFDFNLKTLLRKLQSHPEPVLSSTAQLAAAIDHQQQIQQQFEQQLQVYQQILQLAPIGYLQVDDENRLVWCNPQSRMLLGIIQDCSPKPRLLLEVVRSYELDQLIEQTRQAGKPQQQDWTFYPISPDPTHLSRQQDYPLRGYGLPLPAGQVGIFLENRWEATTLTQQRNRWTSDVAHELKTPLTSIRLVAETLQARINPALRGWLDRLINETIRLSNLVQDLLDLSQLEQSSSQCLQFRTVDLVELIHAAWLNLEPLASKKHLQLDYSGPMQLLMQLDEPRMYRVLINLLDNSIKYSPPRQWVKVRVAQATTSPEQSVDGLQVCLEVIDAGSGFLEHDLPHVFERFYRADPSRRAFGVTKTHSPTAWNSHSSLDLSLDVGSRKSIVHPNNAATDAETDRLDLQHRSSSGLGLAIVEQIVEAHLGSVTASNHPETGGAWLQVRLPLKSLSGETPTASVKESPTSRKAAFLEN
jgi:two-component system, OmpR family, phosphate regulon sensor histidine kinase PhoR